MQGPECLQPLLRLLKILLRPLALLTDTGSFTLSTNSTLSFGIANCRLLAADIVADGGELLVETGGAKDHHVFTHLARVRALVFLIIILVDGENNMPGSGEIDVLVVAASADVEASCSLGSGSMLGGDRDTKGRGVWVASDESRVGQGDGIKEPIARLFHNARFPDFYVVVGDIATIDERAALDGDDAALLEAERPKLDSDPDDGQAGGLSSFEDVERVDTGAVHAHRIHATAKAVG